MGLNQESPYVGDEAVRELADVTSPNILRAIPLPPRPDPTLIPPEVEDGTAAVVGDSIVDSASTEDNSRVESEEGPEVK